jgi:nucleoid-associated protein YgaU
MIYTDSRYAKGHVSYVNDSRLNQNQITVYRVFPTVANKFMTYTWTSEDRIDVIASEFLGSANLWWKIMDINPEIANPFEIIPGTALRIPNA